VRDVTDNIVHTVAVEAWPTLPSSVQITVHTPRSDLPRIAKGELQPDESIHAVVPANLFLESPETFSTFQGRLVLLGDSDTPGPALRQMDALRGFTPTWQFEPHPSGDAGICMAMASLGFPVHLTWWRKWPENVLRELLDYFLFSPVLEATIEPFCSLSSAIARCSNINMRELSGEVLGANYYVTSQGHVSLSRRWTERGCVLGTLDDTAEAFRHSPLWRDLEEMEFRTFSSLSRCSTCPHYRYCRGYWTTTEVPNEDCRTWRGIMDELAEVFRQQKTNATG